MIYEISAEEFLNGIRALGEAVDKIRIKSILSCYTSPLARTFSSDGGYILLFGKTAFLQGSIEDKTTLRQFLYMSGISFVSGETDGISGETRVYSVLKTTVKAEEEAEDIKLMEPARLMSSVFGYDFDDVYTDLCLRKNRGAMVVLSLPGAVAVIHKTEYGSLLTGVAVEESLRGQGIGTEIVSKAKRTVSGELYVICEKKLERFYEKAGFDKIGNTKEVFIGE